VARSKRFSSANGSLDGGSSTRVSLQPTLEVASPRTGDSEEVGKARLARIEGGRLLVAPDRRLEESVHVASRAQLGTAKRIARLGARMRDQVFEQPDEHGIRPVDVDSHR